MHLGGRFRGRSSRASRRVPQAPEKIAQFISPLDRQIALITHQHHLESLEAQYLIALTRTDKAYQLLVELNYCGEFSEH
jgi:hypothetical protein